MFWLDINQLFLNKNNEINTELMWDLLHPSPTGAEVWVSAVMPTIRKLLNDKPVPASQTITSSSLSTQEQLE